MPNARSKRDPKLDLVLERVVPVPREIVWRAWTEPRHLKKWFTPAPWKTSECKIDLRPGGIFYTAMRGPSGEGHTNLGCFLDVVPQEKLVWTTILGPGYRPNQKPLIPFTAVMTFDEHARGTKYRAHVMHIDAATARSHDEMGFSDGWGAALDQLVAMAGTIK